MDRVIQKKKWSKKRILTILGITGLILLIGGSFYMTSGKSKLNQDRERITISDVTKGPFQESIYVNGMVMPIATDLIPASDGGKVEEKYVEDGTMMKAGDPILRLSNSDLAVQMATQQTAVFSAQAQLELSKVTAQQNTVNKLNALEDVKLVFKEAERTYNMDKILFAKQAIGSQEFQTAENNYNAAKRKLELNQQIMVQDSISNKNQLEQQESSYKLMQVELDLLRQKVSDLIVKAPIAGQLTGLDAEIGQTKNKGDLLGQIDVLTSYKVRVDVDEHYLSRIVQGLRGEFSFADSTYNLEIKKIFTTVKTGGTFQVDMYFLGKVPQGIRRGQTLQIRLGLSDETQAILVPKGGFFQATGGNWIFKLDPDGKTAYRADIQLGRASPDYYEVLQGLKPGDKVITSSYDNYEHIQEIVLTGK
jgi:HlyD family secretion protein